MTAHQAIVMWPTCAADPLVKQAGASVPLSADHQELPGSPQAELGEKAVWW